MRRVAKIAAAVAIAITLVSGFASGQTADQDYVEGVVSGDGSIRVPQNFRTDYVMLGAWSVAGDADTDDAIGLHVVYAPIGAVDEYRKTGKFPDGTVLVKELFNGKTKSLTTGQATSASSVAGYFVMVKDDKGRFPGNPLWGDGWGWSYFTAENANTTVTKDYRAECLACHEPTRASDLVYVQGYPLLN